MGHKGYYPAVTLLQRYFWTQALWPLLLCLSALAALALLTQSLQTLDLIVENRQSAITFLYITALALPQLIAIIMPLAVFMAVLYALNRLNNDSELVVVKASGVSPWQIASPAIRLGIYAMIAHLILNLWVQPYAFRQMRGEILKVRTDIASQMVRAGEFVTPTNGLTVYAREVLPDGGMKGVMIYDERDDLKKSDRYLHELLKPNPREYANRKFKQELAAEGHSRLAAPIYNLALVMLALCFLIRGEHQRLGYGRRIAICTATGFTLRLSGFGLSSAAEANTGLNYVQYAVPGMICFLCLLYLLRRRRMRGFRKLSNQKTTGKIATKLPMA